MTDRPTPTSEQLAFAEQMAAYPFRFCDPVIVGRHVDLVGSGAAAVWGGSGTMILLGGRVCLATSLHNLEYYEKKFKEDNSTLFQFSNVAFDPLDRVISRSNTLDLCTIDLTGLAIERPAIPDFGLPALRPLTPAAWPPREVQLGERVFFAGWPGAYRQIRDGGRELLHNGSSFIGIPVTGFGGDQFSCKFDRSTWIAGGLNADINDNELGGFSGCPIFREPDTGAVEDSELVGFVKEYSEAFDQLIATNAAFLEPNATLSR